MSFMNIILIFFHIFLKDNMLLEIYMYFVFFIWHFFPNTHLGGHVFKHSHFRSLYTFQFFLQLSLAQYVYYIFHRSLFNPLTLISHPKGQKSSNEWFHAIEVHEVYILYVVNLHFFQIQSKNLTIFWWI